MSEKTEQPTDKRLREARQKGQVAKSADVTSAVQLGVIATLFTFCGVDWLESVKFLINETLRLCTDTGPDTVSRITGTIAVELAKIILTLVVPLTGATLLIQFAQVGLVFSTKIFAKAGNKLNVVNNLKQMFSAKNLFEMAKSLFKIILIGLIFYFMLREQFSSFQYASFCGADCALPLISHLCFTLFLGLLAGYVFFAAADYAFQRRNLQKQLMMSKEEIKQEFKDSEGNPEIKHRRREVHRELLHDNTQQKVRKSSVVIKNPTHLSICLWFDAKECPLPKVIEKAKGDRARMMNAYAEREGIPVVENIPLARGLMEHIEVGGFITSDYFEPVAEILRMIFEIDYDPE
jgi:type III secretion protein U